MKYHFTYHEDPGHAWLEVTKDLIEELSISVSSCSYMKDDKVFLEEDLDAPIFLNALEQAGHEYTYSTRSTDQEHWIRYLERYG